jgi:fatty-acyl-CoA synthase
MTSVGKIYEPELRCDAAARMLRQLLNDQFLLADARVEVRAGGPRGMRVSVSLPKASLSIVPAVKQALDAYLVEAQVPLV